MQKKALKELTPGMKLARSVFNQDGRVLISAGVTISPSIVNKLAEKGLTSVFVQTNQNSADIVSEKAFAMVLGGFYQLEQSIRGNRGLEWEPVKEPLSALIDEVIAHKDKLYEHTDIRIHDAYISGHSVNVAIISALIGLTLGYNTLKIRELALGALFHDLGMLMLSRSILAKRGPLSPTEQRQMEEHTFLGFQLLRGRRDITAVIANVAYQHHERLNGSGYPRNQNEDKILEFSRIVSVADVYDAMTSERVYRSALSPSQALSYLRTNAGFLFDPMVVAALIKNIAEYPIGCQARLNNGQLVEVARLNSVDGRRPHVFCLPDGPEIDLMSKPELWIQEEVLTQADKN
jgi:HD-GYP domain-containing protein (c-di-GMP phosphodiesterase class II)